MNIANLDLYDFPAIYNNKHSMAKLASITGGSTLFTKEELNTLPDSDFALIIKEGAVLTRKFPVVDKPHAYASALIFNSTKEALPLRIRDKVAANIVKGVAGHAVTDNIVEKSELEKATKLAFVTDAVEARKSLDDTDFALVIKTGNEKRRLYPINNEHMCKRAAEYFEENYKSIPVDYRHKFAFALTTKIASEGYDVPLPDIISSYYSDSFSPAIESGIISRKLSAKEASVKDAYSLLLKQYKKAHPIKVACLLRDLDKVAGLEESKYFKDAYATVFGKSKNEKTAEGVTIVGKYQFDPQTLSTMPYEPFQDVLSQNDFADLQADPVNNYNALPTLYQNQIADIAQSAK